MKIQEAEDQQLKKAENKAFINLKKVRIKKIKSGLYELLYCGLHIMYLTPRDVAQLSEIGVKLSSGVAND